LASDAGESRAIGDGRGPHPEVLSLRFDDRRSPVQSIPAPLRRPLYGLLLEHAEGAVRREGRAWVPFDLLNDPSLARPYRFEASAGSVEAGDGRPSTAARDYLLAELTWPDAERRLAEVDIALLPVGAIEQHGPHLPLDTDAWDAEHMCHEVALRCTEPRPLVLPLIPALAASSPVVEGRSTGLLDTRLDFYRTNSERVRSMTANVIPEPVYGFDAYRAEVLGAIDRELDEIGAEQVLRGQEWTNARGAIARFDRMAIEIRLIDAQECCASNLAVAAAVSGVVRALVEERWAPLRHQRAWPTESLVDLLSSAIRNGPRAEIHDRDLARMFGVDSSDLLTLGGLWRRVAERTFAGSSDLEEPLQSVLREGTLAERILAALGSEFDRRDLRRVYGELCTCLASGRPFRP